MTTIRRIVVSQIDGNGADSTDSNELRPFGETSFYLDNNDKLTLMMFNGTRNHRKSKVLAPGVLWGSNADSGDGNLYDTIKLIPDAELFANGSNQYIIVDPTGGDPGHIHLRAGGTQDASTADLYLGGEQTFVRVSDTYDNVVIRTTGAVPHSWTFNNNGHLTMPDGTVQSTAWAGGRVVSVPATSLGAAGDKQGDLAFNESYIYYCTQDYIASYQASLIGGYSLGPYPSLTKGSYPQPQAGWTFVWNTVTYTIVAVTDPNPGQWQLQVDQTIDTGAGGTIALIPTATNIWKRVAWSADTW